MARRILQTLSAHGSWSARLTAQLLEFLPLLSAAVAREVLPALPQIVGESDNEVRLLLEALKQLMSAERTLLLPVIGTLGEVQLPEALKPELAQLALGALPLADESDLPTLVRCLMHSLNAANASLALRGLRQQLGALRPRRSRCCCRSSATRCASAALPSARYSGSARRQPSSRVGTPYCCSYCCSCRATRPQRRPRSPVPCGAALSPTASSATPWCTARCSAAPSARCPR